MSIHNHLQKPRIRGLVLFPPLFIIVSTLLVALFYILSKNTIPPLFMNVYLGAVGYLMLGLMLIIWSDNKRNRKYQIDDEDGVL